MHEYTLVVLNKDDVNEDYLEECLEEILAPFDESATYKQEREYVDLEHMFKIYKDENPNLDLNNPKTFLPHMKDYTGNTGYIDNDGNLYYAYLTNPQGKWDWWVLGGRWGGVLDLNYEPSKDPRNLEDCYLCNGTGLRDDNIGRSARAKDPNYTCNGCQGVGQKLKFTLQTDIGCHDSVESVLQSVDDSRFIIPCNILTPDFEWVEVGGWRRQEITESLQKELVKENLEPFKNHIAVVVDIHY